MDTLLRESPLKVDISQIWRQISNCNYVNVVSIVFLDRREVWFRIHLWKQ